MYSTVGEAHNALIDYKQKQNISQAELAHRLGYSPSMISKWLRRKEEMSVQAQIRLYSLIKYGKIR